MRFLQAPLRALWRVVMLVAVLWGAWLVLSPQTPLPREWNVLAPLRVQDTPNLLTKVKLWRALATPDACLAALATGADFLPMAPLEATPICGIPQRVRLSSVGGATLAPLETACPTALRLAMWERHVLDPVAEDVFGSGVGALRHQGSYNCRAIRGGSRPSSHATAAAIDIRGVVLEDGRAIELLGNWAGPSPEARFWRRARDGACDAFVTVLGPAFDPNHADHLHLQAIGWGTCR